MAAIKSFTSLEQSKVLAKILPIESADSHYVRKVTDFRGNPVDGKWSEPRYGNTNSKYAHYVVQNFSSYEKLPAWSLAALLEHLRKIDFFPDIIDSVDCVLMDISFADNEDGKIQCLRVEGKTILDTCYGMILKLHEQNLL